MTFRPENDPTKPDSVPDYDGFGYDSQWTAEDWLTWHRALKVKYGPDEANRRFITAWQGGGFGEDPPLDARSFNSAFRDYARANGFLDALYSGLGALAKPLGTANDVLDGATALGSGVKNSAKTLGFLLPALVLGGLAFAAWYYMPKRRPA